MSFTILTAGPQMRAELTGDLTIAEAAETRDALALALTTSETLELDLGDLENVDIAGLQILLALGKEAHSVRFGQLSPPLLRVLELLQITSLQVQ